MTKKCKFLVRVGVITDGRTYVDCIATDEQCPKAANKRQIGQRCWQVQK